MTGRRNGNGLPIPEEEPAPDEQPPAPPAAYPAIHTNLQWLRNHIGGGWQWNKENQQFEVPLTQKLEEYINQFLAPYEVFLPSVPLNAHHADGTHMRTTGLAITAALLEQLQSKPIPWNDRSLVTQYTMQTGEQHRHW